MTFYASQQIPDPEAPSQHAHTGRQNRTQQHLVGRHLHNGKFLLADSLNGSDSPATTFEGLHQSQSAISSQSLDIRSTGDDNNQIEDALLPSVKLDGYDDKDKSHSASSHYGAKKSPYTSSDLKEDENEHEAEHRSCGKQHPTRGGKHVLPSYDSDVDNITESEEGETARSYSRDTDQKINSSTSEEDRESESYRGFNHCHGGKFKKIDSFLDHKKSITQSKLKAEQDASRPGWAHLTPEELVQKASETLAHFEAEETKTKAYLQAKKKARYAAKKDHLAALEERKAREAVEKALQDEVRLTYCGKRLPTNYREPSPNTPEPEEEFRSSPSSSPSPEPEVKPESEQTPRLEHPFKRLTRGSVSQEEHDIDSAIAASLELVRKLQAAKAALHASKSEIPQTSGSAAHTGTSPYSRISRAEHHRKNRYIVSDDEDEDFVVPSLKSKQTSTLQYAPLPKRRKRSFIKDDDDASDSDFSPIKKPNIKGPFFKSPLLTSDNNISDDASSDSESYLLTPPKKLKVSKATISVVNQAVPSTAGRPAGWSDEEHDALERCVRNERRQERLKQLKPLRDMTLWNHMAALLARDYQIVRGGGACKNYWNRYGRARSGFDERSSVAGVQRDLITSFQGTKKR